jgi:hypothetical protein
MKARGGRDDWAICNPDVWAELFEHYTHAKLKQLFTDV